MAISCGVRVITVEHYVFGKLVGTRRLSRTLYRNDDGTLFVRIDGEKIKVIETSTGDLINAPGQR